MAQQKKPSSNFYDFGKICAVLCAAQVILFAFISVWVTITHELQPGMASLWLLGIPMSVIAAPVSFFWSIAAYAREEPVKGSVAFLSAVITPIWFMYGIVNATTGP